MSKKKLGNVDQMNSEVLADLIVDSQTPDHLRVQIIQKLLDRREGQDFFKTMLEDGLSFGECPCCGHQNHWAIPEDELNQMGWVSQEKDKEVPEHTNSEICPDFAEACKKKKITV
jgi:Zn ribbon nucleic-acid-binding protein